MSDSAGSASVNRRTALKAIAGTAALSGASGAAAAQDGGNGTQTEGGGGSQIDYGGWLDDVDNYDGTTEDLRGQNEVTVDVGAGTGIQFGPPAIQVDPGTTVTWQWTGQGGSHNVVDEGGAFSSELKSEQGATFQQTFDSASLYKYYCEPHRQSGMKAAVAVGNPDPSAGQEESSPPYGMYGLGAAVVMAFLSPLVFAFFLLRHRDAIN